MNNIIALIILSGLSSCIFQPTSAMILQNPSLREGGIRKPLRRGAAEQALLSLSSFLRATSPTNPSFCPIIDENLNCDDMQNIIDAKFPDYFLQNEFKVSLPSYYNNGKQQKNAFICTVKPEMLYECETKSLSLDKVAQCLLTSGYIAATLNQNSPGKHRCISLDNDLCKDLPQDKNHAFGGWIGKYLHKCEHIVVYAISSEVVKDKTRSEIMMKFPEALGGHVFYICAKHSVVAEMETRTVG